MKFQLNDSTVIYVVFRYWKDLRLNELEIEVVDILSETLDGNKTFVIPFIYHNVDDPDRYDPEDSMIIMNGLASGHNEGKYNIFEIKGILIGESKTHCIVSVMMAPKALPYIMKITK